MTSFKQFLAESLTANQTALLPRKLESATGQRINSDEFEEWLDGRKTTASKKIDGIVKEFLGNEVYQKAKKDNQLLETLFTKVKDQKPKPVRLTDEEKMTKARNSRGYFG